uniref:Uncharacterized protein n=1 Tax=Lactuca sativa TaxID=4236 RepID=A0A9R1VUX8_LACSA|nr:hypothetical protein LSAT_V11C400166210 [Lactuca sativa]
MAHANENAQVSDLFYICQTFNTSKEFKHSMKLHAIETRRELELDKNNKNIVKGTIPTLGGMGTSGTNQEIVNEENKCPWIVYIIKWKRDIKWSVKTYIKEHRCLQTRVVNCDNPKFIPLHYPVTVNGIFHFIKVPLI